MVDYMRDSAYVSVARNNRQLLPDHQTRKSLQRHSVEPQESVQALVGAGYTSMVKWAMLGGSDRDKGEAVISQISEVTDHMDPPGGAIYRAQIGSFVAIWEEAFGRKRSRTEALERATHDPEHRIVSVPLEIKQQIRSKYKQSEHAAYLPLTADIDPHNLFWDDAATRKHALGHMEYYPLLECRDSSETLQKTSKLGLDKEQKLELGASYTLPLNKGLIDNSNEVMRRRRIFWFLSNFLEEVDVLTWLKHHTIMNTWIAKRHPSLNAIKQADEESVKAMVDRVKTGDSRNFETAVLHIATDDRMQGFFYDSLIAHGHLAGIKLLGDSAIADMGPQRDAHPIMNQFGHIVNPESGWQPAWIPPGALSAKGGGKTKGVVGASFGAPAQQSWFPIAGGGIPKPAGQGISRGSKQRRAAALKAANANNQHQISANLKPPRFQPPPGLDLIDPGKGNKGGGGKGGKKKGGKGGKGGKGNKGKHPAIQNVKGDPNGKGDGKGPKLEAWEKSWFDNLTSWGEPRRCVFWNATHGCPYGASCRFTHNVCLICGMGHKAVDHHWKDDPVTQ